MDTVFLDEKRKREWEEFLYGCGRTIAWQSFDWNSLLKKHYDVEFYPIAAVENGRICGILPLYCVSTSSKRKTLISVPYAVAGGIASEDSEAGRLLLEKAMGIMRERGADGIVLKQYKYKVDGDLRTDDRFYNKELDLTVGPDRFFAGFLDRNKERITEMEGHGLTLEYPSGDVGGFYGMLLRHHHARGIPCVSRKWIQSLIDFGMYKMALIRDGKNVRAGTLIKEFKKTVSFPFSCSPTVGDENYIYRLYWELLNRFFREGKEIFHSGRIPVGDATDEFRLGWGGVAHEYFYQYHPNNPQKTEYSAKRGLKRKVLENLWRMMPIGAAGVLGPRVVKRFP